MNSILNDFGSFLDGIRKSRNISRENFIDGIISLRQYQRYVNGESTLNNEKLFKLIDKLGMNFIGVYRMFLKKEDEDSSNLNEVYKEIIRMNYVKANDLLKQININSIKNSFNKSLYELCNLLILRKTKKIPVNLAMDRYKQLINYPKCLDNEIINFIELVSFIEIGRYSNEKDRKRVTIFLYSKILENSISSYSLPASSLPSIYSAVSRSLGQIDEFKKSLYIAQKGIDYCLTYDNMNSLVNLLYYKALNLKLLNQEDNALVAIRKMFALLQVEGKPDKTNDFTKIFEENFNMRVSQL